MEFNTQDMKRISEIARKMKGKSEDQIIKELSHMIRAGEGGLTPEKAESMFKMILPLLTAEQINKVKKLMDEL